MLIMKGLLSCLTLLVTCSCAVVTAVTISTQDVTVSGLGTFRGTNSAISRLPFDQLTSFQGIPYAKPPVGERRFQPPEAHGAWTGTLTDTRKICLGSTGDNLTPSEDCLYLNVYVPGAFSASRNLPVLVYIHGGGFVSGSPFEYDVDDLIKDSRQTHEVILVTMSYRLGVLGFLTTGDGVVSGNMGLQDQAMAIQWVYDHISDFGGNNMKITVMGQSIGALSVLAHVLHAGDKPFQRVIIQSAPLNAKIPDKSYQRVPFMDYARRLSCDRDSVGAIQCLRAITPASALMNAQGAFALSRMVIDGEYVRENLFDALSTADLSGFTAIIGFNSEEADDWIALNYGYNQSTIDSFLTDGLPQGSPIIARAFGFCLHVAVSEVGDAFDGGYSHVENMEHLTNKDYLLNKIRMQYLPDDSNQINNMEAVLAVTRDCLFTAPALEIARAFGNQRGYLYFFDHWRPSIIGSAGGVQLHAGHSDELPYVFGYPAGAKPGYEGQEPQLSASMLAAWRSFARTGIPIHTDLGGQIKSWTAYDASNGSLLVLNTQSLDGADGINSTSTTMMDAVRDFWSDVRAGAVFMTPSTVAPSAGALPAIDSSSSEEFESEYLKLGEFEADLVILLLAIGFLAMLLICIGLACKLCNSSPAAADKYQY